jgi:hypothetical protein
MRNVNLYKQTESKTITYEVQNLNLTLQLTRETQDKWPKERPTTYKMERRINKEGKSNLGKKGAEPLNLGGNGGDPRPRVVGMMLYTIIQPLHQSSR